MVFVPAAACSSSTSSSSASSSSSSSSAGSLVLSTRTALHRLQLPASSAAATAAAGGSAGAGVGATVSTKTIMLIDLGLPPVLPLGRPTSAAAAAAGPPPRSLPGDLGAVLDAQPDDSADVIIRVGERRFHAHRLILSARCDYFKQRLEDTFSLLLRWLYTGGATVPPEQAQGVAELADRLLLPELCAAAQEVVAASVAVDSVVDRLLWAWGCSQSRDGGGGFGSLLDRLKEWYVDHQEEVRQQAGASRRRLAAAPEPMEELMDAALDVGRPRAAHLASYRSRSRK
ncbi:hypothetical protein HXX76_001895 [Chlamydomonas incerta]|uniref:BTB domain-containing protein n=1 Tax=Chlamydomonas incerta TaxID=51695 RepID=A0A835TEB6_CHLIN|nr:hypothetical protein HXX76_001895 [Chlamydomonas incerta]|eukprot:KAG2443543.1 hypothetical protein HXX76_001895 [Chlamydomonas incerta]